MDDVLTRLRHAITTESNDHDAAPGTTSRQRHIDRVNAMLDGCDEIERLRAALEPFASYAECFNRDFEDDDPAYGRITVGDFRRARNVNLPQNRRPC
jgi:hypothetical protein